MIEVYYILNYGYRSKVGYFCLKIDFSQLMALDGDLNKDKGVHEIETLALD